MKIGIVLGSGLGSFADQVNNPKILKYEDVLGNISSSVEGHKGQYVIGELCGKDVVVMQGRVHYYEGYSMKDVVRPIVYMIEELDIDRLILTNAAGCINTEFAPGELMLITDHISSFVPSPLIGVDLTAKTGARFHDMTHVYDPELIRLITGYAEDKNITLRQGYYLQTSGPNYETPAEIKMYKTLGADAVGMSTVVEAMYAHALGTKVAAISCLTNYGAGITGEALSHEEVQEVAAKVKNDFEALLMGIIDRI